MYKVITFKAKTDSEIESVLADIPQGSFRSLNKINEGYDFVNKYLLIFELTEDQVNTWKSSSKQFEQEQYTFSDY